MEIRMRPQTPREQFEPDGDPYVLRGRQRELEHITENWAKLPEWVCLTLGSPGQGKSTLVRALAQHAEAQALLPILLDSTHLNDADHIIGRTFDAMRDHQHRAAGRGAARDYPKHAEELRSKTSFGSERSYDEPRDFVEMVTPRGWSGAVVLVDDADHISSLPVDDERHRHLESFVYHFDECLNSGSYARKGPGMDPVCLVLVGTENLHHMMVVARFSRLATCLRADLPAFDEPTAVAVLRDHLDVTDAAGVRPATVPDEWIAQLASQHQAHVRDLAAAGHFLQTEAMAAARSGAESLPADALDRIEANVQDAQVADCVRRFEQLTPLERLVAHAAAQCAALRENRIKDQFGSRRKALIRQVVVRAVEHDPTLAPAGEGEEFGVSRDFLRTLDNRLLNVGVVNETDDRWYSEDEFWSMGTPTLGPWLEQHRQEGLAQAAPRDRWRWDWTKDIWEAFRDESERFRVSESDDEVIPEATEPDPAETTAAPPRPSELPAPGEVPPWGTEDTTA